jgi:surface polysaccharide O-acyltransferase-like enzyme
MEVVLYIIASYILHMGMIINEYDKPKNVPIQIKVSLLFAPITVLLILGMMLNKIDK